MPTVHIIVTDSIIPLFRKHRLSRYHGQVLRWAGQRHHQPSPGLGVLRPVGVQLRKRSLTSQRERRAAQGRRDSHPRCGARGESGSLVLCRAEFLGTGRGGRSRQAGSREEVPARKDQAACRVRRKTTRWERQASLMGACLM